MYIINLLDLKEEQVENITLNYQMNKLLTYPQCFKSSDNIKDNGLKEYSHQIITHFDTIIYYQVSAMSVLMVIRPFLNVYKSKGILFPEVLCIDEFYFNKHSKYKYIYMIMV